MHARRNYHVAGGLLVLDIIVACGCFYNLTKFGLADPKKAQLWFALLLSTLLVGMIICLAFYYLRTKLRRSSRDEIAMQALVAAGRNLAQNRQQTQAADDSKQPAAKPPKV